MADANLQDIENYVEKLFLVEDAALDSAVADAREAGLPEIQISPLQGKLLGLMVAITGAKRVLEIGTLGGYSGIHLARALSEDGELITLELEERHAEVARKNFDRAELSSVVEVRTGDAKETLRGMISSGESPFDLIFVDAEKEGYEVYLDLALELSRVGTVIIADNVIRGGSVINGDTPDGKAIDQFNRKFARSEHLEGTIIPMLKGIVDGIAVARVVRVPGNQNFA